MTTNKTKKAWKSDLITARISIYGLYVELVLSGIVIVHFALQNKLFSAFVWLLVSLISVVLLEVSERWKKRAKFELEGM